MSQNTKQKRKLTALQLPAPTKSALKRIKRVHGISQTMSIVKGVALLEKHLLSAV